MMDLALNNLRNLLNEETWNQITIPVTKMEPEILL